MIGAYLDTQALTLRALRETLRQPAIEIGSFFIPMFVFAVAASTIGNIAEDAFGVENYVAFLIPSVILQSAAGAGGSSGSGMVADIHSGYFEKLILTPTPRISLIAHRLIADGVRAMVLAVMVLGVGLAAGSGLATGVPGFITIVLLSGLFGLSFAGLGLAIALKTGSAQADSIGFLAFFPLLFLSPALTPEETFSGWLDVVSKFNPVTYILEGMRDLVIDGWDVASLLGAIGAILLLAVITWSLSMWTLDTRTR